jgi:transcriptional regulator with XRE-family HTH domain
MEAFSPDEIRALRLRENASQAIFALHLNVTTGLVSQWESGEKQPSGASLKLLTLVARKGLQAVHNDYLEGYNTRRSHQGRGMNGRTPIGAFIEGMPKTNNTEVTSETKTIKLKVA